MKVAALDDPGAVLVLNFTQEVVNTETADIVDKFPWRWEQAHLWSQGKDKEYVPSPCAFKTPEQKSASLKRIKNERKPSQDISPAIHKTRANKGPEDTTEDEKVEKCAIEGGKRPKLQGWRIKSDKPSAIAENRNLQPEKDDSNIF